MKNGLRALLQNETTGTTRASSSSSVGTVEAAGAGATLGNQSSNWESRGCCLFQQFNSCFETLVKGKCNESGEEQLANYVLKLREANFGSLQSVLCTKNMMEKVKGGKIAISSSVSGSTDVPTNVSYSECEGLISTPSSTLYSSIITEEKDLTTPSVEEDKKDDEVGGSKKLKTSQMTSRKRYDSLLATLVQLYQKFWIDFKSR